MSWILIDKENKKENILVSAFMQICSLTMSVGKMRTTSKTYIVSNALSYSLFFYIVLLFPLFTPFSTFFLFLSPCLSLIHARISLRSIEHYQKKALRLIRQFSTLKRAFSDLLKKNRWMSHSCQLFTVNINIYGCREISMILHRNYYDSIIVIMPLF